MPSAIYIAYYFSYSCSAQYLQLSPANMPRSWHLHYRTVSTINSGYLIALSKTHSGHSHRECNSMKHRLTTNTFLWGLTTSHYEPWTFACCMPAELCGQWHVLQVALQVAGPFELWIHWPLSTWAVSLENYLHRWHSTRRTCRTSWFSFHALFSQRRPFKQLAPIFWILPQMQTCSWCTFPIVPACNVPFFFFDGAHLLSNYSYFKCSSSPAA